MRITTRVGATLILLGILVLVLANWRGKQTLGGMSAAMAEAEAPPVRPLPSPAPSAPGSPRPIQGGDQPTIFEALLGVLDSTDEGRAIDKQQRDQMRRDLTETNKVWRGMKEDMKESIRRANQRYAVSPNRDVPNIPAP